MKTSNFSLNKPKQSPEVCEIRKARHIWPGPCRRRKRRRKTEGNAQLNTSAAAATSWGPTPTGPFNGREFLFLNLRKNLHVSNYQKAPVGRSPGLWHICSSTFDMCFYPRITFHLMLVHETFLT